MRPQSMGERLSTFLAQPAAPFDWAGGSCAHWAAAWVLHATGVQVALPAFDSPREALRAIEVAGGMAPAVDAALGVVAKPAGWAQIGDLVLYQTDGQGVGWALGICNGMVSAVRDESGSVVFLPTLQAAACWSLSEVTE